EASPPPDVPVLHLFERIGVELEYMIVDAATLAVRPVSDRILPPEGDRFLDEPEFGSVCWSNELTGHVIELKVREPAATLEGLAGEFHGHVERIDAGLAPPGARLMPGGMHPWMDPLHETQLWAYGNGPIYDSYNRIFGCRGHGWANLQSTHVNLP